MGYYGHCVGMDSGSLSTDLKQSYEHVSLSALGGEAVAAQFNLKVLRAACALYSGLGGITFQEVAVRCSWCLLPHFDGSEEVHPSSAVRAHVCAAMTDCPILTGRQKCILRPQCERTSVP
ncbi:unnamed protein product [Prorocentrum cordatum]|uniref:Uncharacterized protein n=2 Tax=Prorocentrum cordatum TaxID=2364126 RepID=A0ABN9YIM7_9DINO|nr:unnamed protein product [Polarella glacialis]